MEHELKILPEYFEAVFNYKKNFEVRENDRGYKVGDILILKEWEGEYTGRELEREITYILTDDSGYVLPGYVVMSIRK